MRLIRRIEDYPLLTIIILTAVMLLPSLGELKVTIMEARNFISAREMLMHDNWIMTTMNEVARYQKPPLPTWLTALAGLIFGIEQVWALRLPTVIMVALLGIYVHLFSKEFVGRRLGLINGLIAITSFYVFAIIFEAPWDIYAHTFMLIGIYHFYKALSEPLGKRMIYAVFFLACSFLSKGPIAVYALLLPFIFAYCWVYQRNMDVVKKIAVFILGGVAIGSWWFIYVRLADAETFMQVATQETSNWTSYQVKPIYYYWSFFTQSGMWTIPALMSLIYPLMVRRVENRKAYQFSFIWTLGAVVLLSLVPEKKSRYLMPVLIPLAMNTGFYIHYLLGKSHASFSKKEMVPIIVHYGILAGVFILTPIAAFVLVDSDALPVTFENLVLCITIWGFGILTLMGIIRKDFYNSFYWSVFSFVLLLSLLLPLFNRLQHKNPNFKSIKGLNKQVQVENTPMFYWDRLSPEMIWEYGGSIPKLNNNSQNIEFPINDKFGILLTDKENFDIALVKEKYNVTLKNRYDLNVASPDARRYRKRLVTYYYLLEKK
ncbi:glycosyltransferase [Prolixibacteraceae bacterium JC049]|nr:glycosyltransferase [Prolixibacteraceae bacterium JC049]